MSISVSEDSALAGPEARPRRGRPSRRILATVATFALAAGFTYLAVRGVHWHAAWVAVEHCHAWWLVPAMVAFAAQTLMRAMRWRSLFAHDRRPRRGPVIEAMLVGYLFNNVMPARAGEVARVASLTRNSSTPAAEIVGTVIVERAYDVFAVLLIFFCAAPFLPHVSWIAPAAILAAVAAAGLAGVVAILAIYGERPLHWLARPLARVPRLTPSRIEHHVQMLANGLSGLRDWRVAVEGLIWSLAAWITTALWAWLVLLAFHQLGFSAGVLVMVAVGLSMIIPSPPAAIGVFEAAGVLALQAFGIDRTGALPYAIVLHISNFVPLVLAGAIALHITTRRDGRRPRFATYTSPDPAAREHASARDGDLRRQLRHGRQAADRVAEDG
ncbi:MAG TPA: lysylphosphatidylglycerol synthase transmembrane domain-containing protein [Solirubrobacteraceae bacterium]|nr:lysylphosphatidylglycerol synthase transmembrane domain-containing protein [Solirubrobacteraceae bacterium]